MGDAPATPPQAIRPTADSAETPAPLAASPLPGASVSDFRSAITAYERALLEDGLSRNRFNQRATAAALGLSYDQLRHALKRHKLTELEAI